MSIVRSSKEEFEVFRHTALRSTRSCVLRHRIHMHLSIVPTALDAGQQYRDRHVQHLSVGAQFLIAIEQRLYTTPGPQPVHIVFERAQMGEHAILRRQPPPSLQGQGIRV